ncbi:hypothetical protein pdam_00018471 [Pocillopora damicornis]|uniref:Uncharacterized protein n=1 Tax=Pocillopora damicornis TaxID=46731 RepID=A0A3M6UDX6_POCDA|nr:hypothetical protein pdam_00018471 [Pocillopora damicornis]
MEFMIDLHSKLDGHQVASFLACIGRSTETFHDQVCGKHFISGKAAKLWNRYDPDLIPTQNLGHQKCGSVEKLQANLEAAAKRDCERARDRELKRVAGERERQLWEEIESKKQIIDEPGVKLNDHRAATFMTCIGTEALDIHSGLRLASRANYGRIDKVLEMWNN